METDIVDPAVVKEFRAAITEFEAKMSGKHVTQEQAATMRQELEGKFAAVATLATLKSEIVAEYKAELDLREKSILTAAERRAKELSAHGSTIITPTDHEIKSLGTRFVETPEYKAWAAGGDQRTRLNITTKGRIREGKAAGTITLPSSAYPVQPYRAGFYDPPVLPLGMRDLFNVQAITVNSVEYVVTTWEYAADYQLLEGDKKAQGNVTYVDKNVPVRTLAWYVKASRQMLADAPYFASTIDSQLLYGLAKKEDHELLHGDNAAGHLHGLLPQATALPADVIADILYSADQVLAAIAYLRSLGHAPTGIVMNPIDWASMQIAKTAQGIYILGGPPQGNAAMTLWGIPVVTTSEMTAGTFLVGAFPPNATLFDRETATVDVAYENEDDFIRNLVTFRCEERLALAVYRPQAFVKGTIPPPPPVLGGLSAQGSREGRDKK